MQTYLAEVLPALAARGVRGTVLAEAATSPGLFAGAQVVATQGVQRDGARLRAGAGRRLRAVVYESGADVCLVHIAPSPGVPGSVGVPSVVFAHDYFPACPGYARYLYASARFCAEGPGLRCYRRAYTERCANRRPDRLLRANARERAWRRGWAGVARVVVASSFVAEVLVSDGAPRDRLDIVPYFVAPAPPRPATTTFDVLFVGRLVATKGADVLLRALATLPGRSAVVAGEGPERLPLERLAHDLGIADRVSFPGSVSPERRGELLAQARVFALPSLWSEPFGIAGLEALAAGVPVVASDAGGIPTWLPDGEPGGARVRRGDVGALAAALERLLGDEPLRVEAGQAARETAARFSLAAHVDGLMRSLAAAQPTRTPRART